MSAYPEDVMKAARKAVMPLLGWESPDGARIIARALMAERQRCADIVLNANALNADERYFLKQVARKIISQTSSAASSSEHRPSEQAPDQRQRSCNGDGA